MKNHEWKPYIRATIAGFATIALSVLFFFLLYRLSAIREVISKILEILKPFIYGGVIAYLLRPLCNWLEMIFQKILPKKLKKCSDAFAIVLSMLVFVFVIYALIIMVAPQLASNVVRLWNAIPGRIDDFIAWFSTTFEENETLMHFISRFASDSDTIYAAVQDWAADNVLPYISNLVGGVGSILTGVGKGVLSVALFLKDFLIGMIVAIYLLFGRKRLARQCTMILQSIFSDKWSTRIIKEVRFVDKMFGGFIDGKIFDSAIIGVLCYIGCLIFRFPNALLVSVIVGVTNVIPFFGPFIGAIPSTFLILLDSPIKALWFVVFVFALQQLDGNVIGPKILGERTGLSSFWVLFAIVLGGGLFGLVGMVVCVPFFAVLYDLITRLVYRGLRKNGHMEYFAKDTSPEMPSEETKI